MLEEGALGRGRRGSRTPESGGSSSNQSPQPDSWRKTRRNESRRSRTPRRRQRAASGLALLDSRKGLCLSSVVLHRDDALVPEMHDGRGLRRPVGAADLTGVRDDDHSVLSAFQELQVTLGEALLVPVAKRLHDVVSAMAVPLPRLGRMLLHIRVEDLLDRFEVTLTPSFQALPRDLGRLAVHLTRIRPYFNGGRRSGVLSLGARPDRGRVSLASSSGATAN